MRPVVAWRRQDAAADPLADPVIVVRAEEMAVPRQYLLADCGHLRRREAGVEVEVAKRAVEPGDMLLETKRPAAEAAGHIEHRIALQKALVAERDHDLALAHELAVEPGDALVFERHCCSFRDRIAAISSSLAENAIRRRQHCSGAAR